MSRVGEREVCGGDRQGARPMQVQGPWCRGGAEAIGNPTTTRHAATRTATPSAAPPPPICTTTTPSHPPACPASTNSRPTFKASARVRSIVWRGLPPPPLPSPLHEAAEPPLAATAGGGPPAAAAVVSVLAFLGTLLNLAVVLARPKLKPTDPSRVACRWRRGKAPRLSRR